MEQPKFEMQKALDEILEATPTEVEFDGRTLSIGWLRHYAQRKVTHLMLTAKKDENEDKVDADWKRNVQIASILILGRKWKIVFFHWLYWRWLYYMKDIDHVDVLRVLDVCKKKVQLAPSLMCTMLAVGLMDTMMTMASHELTQAGQGGVLATA